uniref:IPT/TIG domain-containing protein n=1 Tax=Solibacter usitatus (strain Ellin6076) TaxID=234267 RepID=Q01SD1_SOLUE
MRVLAFAILTAAVAGAHGKLPMAFEANQGQTSAEVQYIAHGNGYAVTLTSDKAELISHGGRLSTTFLGAGPVTPETETPLPGVVNYLVGNAVSWRTGIPTYARVRYRNVYPGIDVVYYGRDGHLEYDFILAPGADPRRIAVRFDGAQRLSLDRAGDLLLATAAGEIRQHRPELYQEAHGVRRTIPGRYILRGQTIRFDVGAYDRALPLVIDPTLTWASYFGGGTADQILAVTTDSSGNVYATGSTVSTRGDYDAFITKTNSSGTTAILTTLVGGTLGDDEGHGIAVDSAGNMYLSGVTGADDFPIVVLPTSIAGLGYDAFVTKVDPTGKTYLYAGYIGGSGDDVGFALALDPNNNLWIAGATTSTNFPLSRTGTQRTLAGGIDGFISEFDPNGALLYSSYLGGSGDDYIFGIGLDATGNVYTAGSTASTDFPGPSSGLQSTNGGGVDAWVARMSPGGALVWSTYLGGSGDDEAAGLAVDGSGTTYITGDTASSNFPTANAFQATFGGGPRDIIAAKISPDGKTLLYSSFLGGSGDEIGNAIGIDFSGNAYIGGSTNSTNFPSNFGFQTANKGGVDGTISGISADGKTLQFSSYIGGATDDYVEAVAVNCTTGLLIGGQTTSTAFPTTAGVIQPKFGGGGSDGFLAQIAAGTATTVISPGGIVNAATSSPTPVSPGSLVSIYGANLAGGVFNASSTPLSNTLGGTTVTVNGATVPLIYVSPGQINFQLPYEVSAGTASATVAAGCGTSTAVSFQVAPAAPYLLLAADGSALVQNQDFSFNSSTNAAPKGSVVTAYLIGIGPLDNPVATGAAASTTSLSTATSPAKATIGGFDTSIKFLGLTPGFVGLAQANLEIPNLSPGKYPIVITVGGVDSNAGTLWVK